MGRKSVATVIVGVNGASGPILPFEPEPHLRASGPSTTTSNSNSLLMYFTATLCDKGCERSLPLSVRPRAATPERAAILLRLSTP